MLLTSPNVKCMKLDPTINQEIIVEYHFPDIITFDGDELSNDDPSISKDDISAQNSAQYKRKLQEAQAKNHPLYDNIKITMAQRVEASSEKRKRWRRNRNNRDRKEEVIPQGTEYLSESVQQQRGTLKFLSSPSEPGIVEICLQSQPAGTGEKAIRFSLDISIKEYVDPDLAKKEIGKHVSKMEQELRALQTKVKYLIQRGNQDKEEEVGFHDKTITVNKAMRFWPMFHIFVLILVSVFQVNHIIKFFQKKNMIL